MATIRTFSDRQYASLSSLEIKNAAKAAGVKAYSADLVEDLANIMSGGGFNSPSEIEKEVQRNVSRLELIPDEDGDYYTPTKGYTKDVAQATKDRIDYEVEYHSNINNFIQNIDLNVPGDSPLEKAFNIIKYLGNQTTSDSGETSSGESVIPIFSESRSNSEKLASKLNDAIELNRTLDEEDKELLELEDEDSTAALLNSEVYREILKASMTLDSFSAIQTKPSSNLKKSPAGDVRKIRSIRGFDEFDKIHHSELINPRKYMGYRVINGEAIVS